MDRESFSLLSCVATAQLDRISSAIDAVAVDERGSTYVRFVHLHLDAIAALVAEANVAHGGTESDEEQEIHGRQLQRLKLMLDAIHGNVFSYRDDIGRRDFPVGLLYLIDTLIDDLLKASADPLVHSDGNYMYSTIRLQALWAQLTSALGVEWEETTEPIIFNLPGLDPSNAMLAPILAHEVGHSVLQRVDLVDSVEQSLDRETVDSLRRTLTEADPSADQDNLLLQFARWVEELVCDALATELCGVSMLFSSAVFLPASAAGSMGDDHPDPADRLALTLTQLDENGWADLLVRHCPNVDTWLRQIAEARPTPATAQEKFLRDLIQLAMPAIVKVAREYAAGSFECATFEVIEEEILSCLRNGIPPAELRGSAVSPWVAIVGFWLRGVEMHGDTSIGLASVVGDRRLSRLALKTVEMSRVLQLWGAD